MSGFATDSSGVMYATDPRKRWVSGYVTYTNPRITYRMPVISQITEKLWMGGVEPGLILPDFIENVINLSDTGGYIVEHKIKSKLAYRMEDSPKQDLADIYSLARWVSSRDEPTLVHCHMGLNRSGVVVAAALLQQMMPPEVAIALLREKRSPAVLCNSVFERFILEGYVYG